MKQLTCPLWGESTGHRWIPLTNALLNEQSSCQWFKTPCRSLLRNCNHILHPSISAADAPVLSSHTHDDVVFRVTDPLCGKFTGPGEFPAQRPVTRSFNVFFDLRPNKRLSKQSWGWWFGTPSWSLWRQWHELLITKDLFLFLIPNSHF